MRRPARQFGALSQPLDQLLGAPARVRALRSLQGAPNPVGLAHLAREMAVTYRGAQKAVAVLVDAGIVMEVPTGQGAVFGINEGHPLLPALRLLFSAERERRTAVVTAVDAWADRQSPALLAVWLFGSAARDEDVFRSDIDLAVACRTYDDAQRLAIALRQYLAPIALRQAVQPSVLPYTASEVISLPASDPPMWANLVHDATSLFGPAPDHLRSQLVHETGARHLRVAEPTA